MSKYSVDSFLNAHRQDDERTGFFELETQYLLECNLEGRLWSKAGAMVAYRGDVTFTREGVLEHGIGKMFKKALTGERMSLMKTVGSGSVYLADMGKKVQILDLEDDAIVINANDVLAFQDTLSWDVTMMRKVAGMLAGGLFNVRIEGRGMVALTTHHDPLVLAVRPGEPVYTDPNATVAWSGNLEPGFRTDVSFKTFLGRGSGESVQMEFQGTGFVVVQPYEEVYLSGNG